MYETTDSPEMPDYGSLQALKANAAVSLHHEPLLLKLRRQKVEAQNEVQRLDELIKLLAENPATERILELLGRR